MNKALYTAFFALICISGWSQSSKDSTAVFKKRVLETTEVDIISSLYTQDGDNAAVTGGIGSEKLTDGAMDIKIAIPLNDDDILNIDATVSAYTSASSSNLNPFSGASGEGDDDDDFGGGSSSGTPTGSPWYASSGASKQDVWFNANFAYSHSSDSRNTILSTNLSFANEFDYTSTGGGAGIVKLFNDKNTTLSLNGSVFIDWWRPQYPTEIKTYVNENGNLNSDFFQGVPIYNQSGISINKFGADAWKPVNTTLIQDRGRNTYTLSISFAQILSQSTQFSIFTDLVMQKGWLANPMQRVYFADKPNFYIGNALSIPYYTSYRNNDVFQLADDIERLPDSRIKLPIGVRLNQYINEHIVLRTYYRYYFDDWGVFSHTANVEIPIKLKDSFTMYPNYRYYTQTASDYFAPYEQNVSISKYYTSDYDLSGFNSHQIGLGFKYTDIFTQSHIGLLGIKTLRLDYNYYMRNTGLKAHIITFGMSMVLDK